MNKKLAIFTVIILFVGIILSTTFRFSSERVSTPRSSLRPLRVGTVAEYSTLIRVAEQQGFFRENGLEVKMIEYSSGGTSVEALIKGELDLATGADFVGVTQSFNHQNFKIVSSLFASADVFELVARRDKGIENFSDLKGKKIGLSKKTRGEFFLGELMSSHNLSLKDILQIDGQPEVLKDAISKGTVDAVVTFHPHINSIEEDLQAQAIKFMASANQLLYTLVYANLDLIEKKPVAVKDFVLALAKAEQYIKQHPQEMKEFFRRQFDYPENYIEKLLSEARFEISLSQSMLLTMEDQARWILENDLSDKSQIPNYLDFIYFDALAEVKPESISIIH